MFTRLLSVASVVTFLLCLSGQSIAAVFGSVFNHITSRNDLYSIDTKSGVATHLGSIDFDSG
jgi:hypothetical protein